MPPCAERSTKSCRRIAPSCGEIPGLEGVWATADTLEACRDELEDVLEEWIVLSLAKNLPIPTIDGIDLSVSRVP
jgi:predicted RNase H-like HicB family nuclease